MVRTGASCLILTPCWAYPHISIHFHTIVGRKPVAEENLAAATSYGQLRLIPPHIHGYQANLINTIKYKPSVDSFSKSCFFLFIKWHLFAVTIGKSTSIKLVGAKPASLSCQYVVSKPAPRFTTWHFRFVSWNHLNKSSIEATNNQIENKLNR